MELQADKVLGSIVCNNWFIDLVVLCTTCVVTICEGIFEGRVEGTHNCVLSQLFCTRHIQGVLGMDTVNST